MDWHTLETNLNYLIELVETLLLRQQETDSKRPGSIATLVTLDQIAASVGRSKRTLEKYRSRMPEPQVLGTGGKPHLWHWPTVRPWLEAEFQIELDPDQPLPRRIA